MHCVRVVCQFLCVCVLREKKSVRERGEGKEKGGREEKSEGGREGGREEGREGGREGGRMSVGNTHIV